MQKSISLLSTAFICILFLASCHRDNNNSGSCPGTVSSTWKVDGNEYKSSSYVTFNLGSIFNVTFTACVSDGVDKSITIGYIPSPPVVGTYPLKFEMLHSHPWNNMAGADYLIENGENFFTDSTGTGTLIINSVNTTDSTFSGGFNFPATNDAGTQTVQITDGTFTNVKY
ncbi:MAG: DUF6252 family protein [Chitinophagales bacterium]